MPKDAGLKKRLDHRFTKLWTDADTWRAHWAMIAEQQSSRRSTALLEKNKRGGKDDGTRRNTAILNTTPIMAVRTLSSGMMSGITSPSRPWFRLATPDPDKMEIPSVREWLDVVQRRMHVRFARTNLYTALPVLYDDLGTLGTSAMMMDDDDEEMMRFTPLTPGTYVLAADGQGRISTMMREVSMTVEQIVDKFGEEYVSHQIRTAIQKQAWDQEFTIRHAILPKGKVKHKIQENAPDNAAVNMRWFSVYWEPGRHQEGELLKVGGYDRFPVLTPRWYLIGNQTYGRSPGMDCLGDCRQLQDMERRKARLTALMAEPPMKGPPSMENRKSSIAPNEMTYVQETQNGKYEPAYVVDPQGLNFLLQDIAIVEQRIRTAFYVDLFLMLASTDRREITAREVDERHEEKLLQLGPVIERLYDEALDPLVDFTFKRMFEAGEIPPPPPELEEEDLRVELISIMAAAQNLVTASSIDRLLGVVINVAGAKPDVLDKIDADQLVEEYSELLGTPVDIVKDSEDVAQERAARQKAQQAAAAMETADVAAGAAQKASQATTPGGTNVLEELLRQNDQGINPDTQEAGIF